VIAADPTESVIEAAVPAAERVMAGLREMILLGQLPLGGQIPTEVDLGRIFGVGRSSVREAVRVLAAQGLLQTKRGVGGGTYVVVPDPKLVSDGLRIGISVLSLSRQLGVEDLIQARTVLEVPSAGFAAMLRSDEDLLALDEALLEEQTADSEVFAPHGDVHLAILRAAKNKLFQVMVTPIFQVLSTSFERDKADPTYWSKVRDEHRGIVATIREGDRLGAEENMQRHMDTLSELYRSLE